MMQPLSSTKEFVQRQWLIIALAVALTGGVIYLYPELSERLLYNVSRVSLGGLLGYVVDRFVVAPYHRPHCLKNVEVLGAAHVRRGIVVGSCILAMAIA